MILSHCSMSSIVCCPFRCWKLVTASKFVAKYTQPTVQKAESLMVWAAMKSSGAICLRRCPPKVDAAAYQGILESAKSFIRPRYVPHSAASLVPRCNPSFTVGHAGHSSKTGLHHTGPQVRGHGCEISVCGSTMGVFGRQCRQT